MRAGLLSDPRTVRLLQTLFVPCRITARNTADLLVDPRDLELLDRFAERTGERFQGGERELFVLPDGTPQRVFLSLHGLRREEHDTHYTAAGRRSEAALAPFLQHAERALRTLHGELPAAFAAIADGTDAALATIAAAGPRWPEPAPLASALRVHVRNSYRMYDDLHGCELVALDDAVLRELAAPLRAPGDAATLPRETFVALARALVPRGQVATRLAAESIDGELRLVVEDRDGDVVRGRIEGTCALAPTDRSEVGRRDNAACLFRSQGRLVGRFALDATTLTFAELRAALTDVDFAWQPRSGGHRDDHPAWHRAAFELVHGPAANGSPAANGDRVR